MEQVFAFESYEISVAEGLCESSGDIEGVARA